MNLLQVTTEVGATYDFTEGMTQVCRHSRTTPLRRDGEWVDVVSVSLGIHRPMRLVLDGVAVEGHTIRVSTPVTMIAEIDY